MYTLTDWLAVWLVGRDRERQTDIQTYRQTGQQTDRRIEGQTDRQIG